MFRLLGVQEIIKNLIRLSKGHLKGELQKQSLQMAYRDFLRKAQPLVPKPEGIFMSLLASSKEIEPLLEAFKEDSILDDFEEVFESDEQKGRIEPIQRAEKALAIMREINPQHADVIELVIHTIFSAPSKFAGGGSTSAAIGCIWVDSRPHWDNQDLLEFLIHETTHNLVFLDELCHTHYSSYPAIAQKKNRVVCDIEQTTSFDKVFHSILVSTEVLTFREESIGHPSKPHLHPPPNILLSQTLRSIEYLEENAHLREFFTSRACMLLDGCAKLLAPMKERIGGLLCEVS